MVNNLFIDPSLVEITVRPAPLTKASQRWGKRRSPRQFELQARGEDGSSRLVATLEARDAMHRVSARTKWCNRIGKRLDLADRDSGRIIHLTSFVILDPKLMAFGRDILAASIQLLPALLMPSKPSFLWMFDWVQGQDGLPADLLNDCWIKLNDSGVPVKASEAAAYAYMPLVDQVEQEFSVREPRLRKPRGRKGLDQDFTCSLTPESLAELVSGFRRYPDPRKEDRISYPAATLLTIIVLARKAGSTSFRTHAAWVGLLSEEQRSAIGLQRSSEDSAGPCDDTIRRFIEAVTEPRNAGAKPDEFPGDRKLLPFLGENVIRGDFNSWLQRHVGQEGVFGGLLWKEGNENKPKRGKKQVRAPWYHVSAKFSQMDRPSPKLNPVIMDSVVWALSDHLEKTFAEKDPRPPYHHQCPLRPVLLLLGLGRCYGGSTAVEIWLWAHRFDEMLLDSVGLQLSVGGRIAIPGPTYLTGVIKDFRRENFEKLDKAVSEWFRKENKVSLLEADGGKLRKVKEKNWRKRAA